MKRDDVNTLLVILIVCIICGGIIYLVNWKSNYDKLSSVNDYSTFFSVVREVDNYIGYVATKNKDAISNLLDSEYLQGEYFDYNYSELTELNCSGIKYIKIGNNYLYFVKGKIVENGFDAYKVINNDFMILVFNDISNNTYSVYPIDDSNYKKAINNVKKISIDKNSNNEMIKLDDFSVEKVCKIYFSDYMNKIYTDIDEAYNILSTEMKKKFVSASDLKKYIDNHDNVTYSTSLCREGKDGDYRTYTVIDVNESIYIFTEKSIMDYDVYFNLDTSK